MPRNHHRFCPETSTLDRKLLLALLPPDAPPLVLDHLPDTLLPEPDAKPRTPVFPSLSTPVPSPTFDASALDEEQRDRFQGKQDSHIKIRFRLADCDLTAVMSSLVTQ